MWGCTDVIREQVRFDSLQFTGDASMVVERLLQQATTTPDRHAEQAWDLLSAAHIVGQTSLGLHFRVHWHMLLFGIQTRDTRETAGQLFRLALVPLGHLLQRLPLGNSGRANVSAFRPMPVAPRLSALISAAQVTADQTVFKKR